VLDWLPVPETLNENVPVVAFDPTLNVRVDVLPEFTELGLKDHVTPAGVFDALSAIAVALPLVMALVTK
jgi:hypothetical protein